MNQYLTFLCGNKENYIIIIFHRNFQELSDSYYWMLHSQM